MSTILVTGGAGFIGSNIVEHLVRRGDTKVKVIDNLSTGYIENIKSFLDEIEFIEGSITDLDLLKKVFKDVDYILHQAAITSVPRSIEDPIRSHLNNASGTLNVLVAARDCGVKRVVYAASSSAYGDAPEDVKSEHL
ncbi:NAD-dependent epimerase/dehydratase family protein, partial [Candidatus Woesearchaeota archaeon]|nr:NAD-dependent epimerase/dehydratase family protein [Candidatus Woesearchaeota archaeon]